MERDTPYTALPNGLRLAVRVVPKASRTGVDGIVRGANGLPALQIRLTAPPADGEANIALIDFLSDVLDVHKNAVHIRSGETSRIKMLQISGDSAKLAAKLDRLAASGLPPKHGQMEIGGLAQNEKKPRKPVKPNKRR